MINVKFIPYSKQSISEDDIQAVVDVLRSDFLTQGPITKNFENAIANYCQSKHAVAVCNGTAALHLACLALDIGKDDIVWTSPNTFVASANCALYCGAMIDFVDIDSRTYNMRVQKLEEKLIQAKKENKLPKLVIPVHFTGQACDMKKIKSLADEYGFYVVEDACHAIGGKYYNAPIGNCQYSDMTVFSFHPVKIITTGEGGAITTNDEKMAKKLRLFLTHGITKNPFDMENQNDGGWYYEQQVLGYNYRITDMQCALGSSQLKNIDQFVIKRRQLVDRYNQILEKLPIILPFEKNYNYSAYHLYVICLKLNELSKTRRQIFNELREAGVGVSVHYIPVHTQPYYQKLGFVLGEFPMAETYYEAALSLPLFPNLSEEQQRYVIETLKRIIV